jgi:hypothetical protein
MSGAKIEAVKGKSPYAKQHKAPFQYSDQYHRWSAAVVRGDEADIEAADASFRRTFGIPATGASR